MLFAKEKAKTAPNGWSDEIHAAFADLFAHRADWSNIALLFLINRVHCEITAVRSGWDELLTFVGWLASPPGSVLRSVRTQLVISPDYVGENDSAGNVILQHDLNGFRPTTPRLDAVVKLDQAFGERLRRMLVETKIFGNPFVPVWVWCDLKRIENMSATEAVKASCSSPLPVLRVTTEQALDLKGPCKQDEML